MSYESGVKNDVVIVGGGLAGLFCALQLNRAGLAVTLIERKTYPFHKVCGEYISNEVRPFLKNLNINVDALKPSAINRLKVSSVSGRSFTADLQMGGFGISRYTFDHYIYELAKSEGVNFITGEKVSDIQFVPSENQFHIHLSGADYLKVDWCIGSFGKRSNIDQKLERDFFKRRSPYVGVKYHIKTDFPENLIQLDLFEGGYCGIQKIEEDKFCLCYLSHRRHLKEYGSIPEMEKNILWKNKQLKKIFEHAEFLYEQPEVINEISFEKKTCVEDHILMCGDAAGMITPLCGNGMAMAMHSSKILSGMIIESGLQNSSPERRISVEKKYAREWEKNFSARLVRGRFIQDLFGRKWLSDMGIGILGKSPFLQHTLVKSTHGKEFS